MADKKIKSNLSLEALLKLPNLTADRVLQISSSGNVENSVVTNDELDHLSGVTSGIQDQINDKIDSTEKGANNGVATLNANGKLTSSQIPAITITEVVVVADIAARDALVIGDEDGEVQEGDVAIVLDNGDGDRQPFIYDGSVWQSLDTTNFDTNFATKDTDDLDEGSTNLYHTAKRSQDAVGDILVDTGIVKLTYDDTTPEIEASIDIPAADAKGSADDADLLLIYDSVAEDHKKITKEDFLAGLDVGASAGDISETDFNFDDDIAAPADVTGLSFAAATVRSFEAQVVVERSTDYEVYKLLGVQKDAGFEMSIEAVGDDTGVAFSITSGGQVQYTSSDSGFGGVMKFRATTLTV